MRARAPAALQLGKWPIFRGVRARAYCVLFEGLEGWLGFFSHCGRVFSVGHCVLRFGGVDKFVSEVVTVLRYFCNIVLKD